MNCERLSVAPLPRSGNAGIRTRYPIDGAAWVWHPDVPHGARSFVEFARDFALARDGALEFEISADQRFILACDDVEFGRGPDRAELGGWSAHRYRVTLPAGAHRLSALAWWLPETERPMAQATARPAFALVGLDDAAALLSTGQTAWRVRSLNGWRARPHPKAMGFHVIGCGFEVDGGAESGPWVTPVTVARGMDELYGSVTTPWRCEPSPLPEQARSLVTGGRIRVVQPDHASRIVAETPAGAWDGLPEGRPVTVPPHQTVQVLWDFTDYVCGYAQLALAGGAGSTVDVTWAEAPYEATPGASRPHQHAAKGDRGACAGKHWLGFGDLFHHPGGARRYASPWWRSGRWLRLAVATASEPLIIRDARPLRTGHPFTRRWAFDCDRDLGGVLDLCERGLRNCAHETFVDCPYYEQMQYVGDTRLQALAWLAATGDPRPVRRALELFDRSRWVNGFVAERAPTGQVQMSATYSLVQPAMLRDYALWTDDAATVRRLLPGTRAALEHAVACLDDTGLPALLPGWLFVDWVARPDWARGVPGATGWQTGAGVTDPPLSAPVALHLPVALEAMARVEAAYGDPLMARRWTRIGRAVMARILAVYGANPRGILSDDDGGTRWSEHAQALALDCDGLPADWRARLLDALEQPADDLARASVYFSFHVHEALLRGGRVQAVLDRFEFWRNLLGQGFLTPVEAPEPSRSDCHGWGAHPLYHCLSALAGVRPAAPGFARVAVTPRFGPLTRLRAEVPHPRGLIRVNLERRGDRLAGTIETPVPGHCEWSGRRRALKAGVTVFR